MKVVDDLINLPNPGVIFSETNFMTAYDWHDQGDADLWYDRVLVPFQENSWVDIITYQHHLKGKMNIRDA